MKFRIKVCRKDDPAKFHWEDYDKTVDDPQEWAENIVEQFNDGLRPGEHARELLEVEVVDELSVKDHKWDKDIRRMSIIDHLGNYDGMICTRCGITGKRFGLQASVTIDSKYRAKVYRRCDTAKVHLEGKK